MIILLKEKKSTLHRSLHLCFQKKKIRLSHSQSTQILYTLFACLYIPVMSFETYPVIQTFVINEQTQFYCLSDDYRKNGPQFQHCPTIRLNLAFPLKPDSVIFPDSPSYEDSEWKLNAIPNDAILIDMPDTVLCDSMLKFKKNIVDCHLFFQIPDRKPSVQLLTPLDYHYFQSNQQQQLILFEKEEHRRHVLFEYRRDLKRRCLERTEENNLLN